MNNIWLENSSIFFLFEIINNIHLVYDFRDQTFKTVLTWKFKEMKITVLVSHCKEIQHCLIFLNKLLAEVVKFEFERS